MANLLGQPAPDDIQCERCQRFYKRNKFYLDKQGNPFKKCKACLTAHVRLDDPTTLMPILQEIDIPFIPSEWWPLVERYRDGKNSNTTVTGRYIGKMKLSQFQTLTFADTEEIMAKEDEQKRKAEEYKAKEREKLIEAGWNPDDIDGNVEEPEFDFGSLFTKQEKKELALKWGKFYREEELGFLENYYNSLHEDYDINTATHDDYCKLICKASLRVHQTMDNGDIEGFNKMAGNYDKLNKSANFTAAQEKKDDAYLDSIGEMVKMCEEQGFIPLYHLEEPKDIVDITLRDINNYTSNLVKNELNLGDLIESALNQLALEEAKVDEDGELDEDALFGSLEDGQLTDQDFFDLADKIEMEVELFGDKENI